MMTLYILRHAIAAERDSANYPNDDRPLTEEGGEKMKKGARALPDLVPQIDLIMTSPFIRAKDTAIIAAEALNAMEMIKINPGLAPGKSARDFVKVISGSSGANNVLVVGHEPQLSEGISLLLGSEKPIVEMKKGGLCCLEIRNLATMKGARLLWHLTPKQLRILGKNA